jgi:hypothetical protein
LRLWSLHPSFLDQKALVAVWREALLARAVLRGATRGYRSHPQLQRFRQHPGPVSAINHYLRHIADEADRRGYRFDRSKIGPVRNREPMDVSSGQLQFELEHLRRKVLARAPGELARLPAGARLKAHPLFRICRGPIAAWERGAVS